VIGLPVAAPAGATGRAAGQAAPGIFIPVVIGPELDAPTRVPERPRAGAGAAAATFQVRYSGFTPAAQAAFQRAVDIWAAQVSSAVPITVNARWEPLDDGVLGAAGPGTFYRDFAGAPRADEWYPIALADKLAGTDLLPDKADIEARFNSNYGSWYFGDGDTPSDKSNFTSVVLHELGHGLGFSGSARYDESTGHGQWGLGSGFPFAYDRFVYNGLEEQLIGAYPNNSPELGYEYTSGWLFFNGPNARAANGGAAPPLYAPYFWEQGSSYSHLDEDTFGPGDPNSLMTPAISRGETILDPGPITRGIFADLGWTASAPGGSPAPVPGQTFADVSASYWAYDQIEQIAARGITTGCGTDNAGRRVFCPERGVTRAEMAVFITRTLGQANMPASGQTFADVPPDYWAYGQIEAFARLGITTGCGVDALGRLLFCPERGVTRAEMAAFLVRAKGQTELTGSAPTFADVPTGYWAYGWIERFLALNVTTGCGTDEQGNRIYCPDRGVTRAEMAVFLIRAYP
jgi:hypothetical protein